MSDAGSFDGRDRAFMGQALALGALAEGTTSPNPRVGCILTRGGRVVGRGFHRAPGEPHAEVVAVRDAGEAARGATLYVNLEPCAHHGRTPPCVELLSRHGISRVVSAMQDPNPMVNGRGFAILRKAGIRVDVGLLGREAECMNEAFVHWHRLRRPLITFKAALTLDGQLSARDGVSRWITNAAARRFAHRLRLRSDAILVGGGTVREDNPRLTIRVAGLDSTPRRVVLSSSLDLDPGARIFAPPSDSAPRTRIYTSPASAASSRAEPLRARAEIVEVPETPRGLDLLAVVRDLAGQGVQSLLVEGGGRTFAAFLRADLADRGALFSAPRLVGSRGATPFVDAEAVAEPALGLRFARHRVIPLGGDLLLLGRFLEGSTTCSPA